MTLETHLMDLIRVAVRDVVREEMGSSRSSTASNTVEYLKIKEAAKASNVSVSTIRKWVRDGAMDVFGEGRVKRVKIGDVRRCLERGGTPESAVDHPEQCAAAILRSLPSRAR